MKVNASSLLAASFLYNQLPVVVTTLAAEEQVDPAGLNLHIKKPTLGGTGSLRGRQIQDDHPTAQFSLGWARVLELVGYSQGPCEDTRNLRNEPARTTLKSCWPELVVTKAMAARQTILRETHHSVNVIILSECDSYTADYNVNRVRLFTSDIDHRTVVKIPCRG